MSTIFLYDIAEGKWYQHSATGQIPENRRKFCAGATWAQDQSSYNIYLYGGAGFAENATGFDDVYILTLPSFTWIKWYPTEPGPGYPHHSLTCNVIDNSQMLIIGGTFPASDACDAPDVWGTHNLDLGKNNPDQVKWNLFNPNLTTYYVPSEIVDVVGGGSTGGATVTAPPTGWDSGDLSVYFQQRASYAARTPTRAIPGSTSTPHDSNESNKNAIIGGTVGGVVGFLLLAGVTTFLCIRKRRQQGRNNKPDMTQSQQGPPSEQDVRTNAHPPSMPSSTPPSGPLPAYRQPKPFPSTTTTTTLSSAPLPRRNSPIHSYTTTPSPMIGTVPLPHHHQPPSPALHPAPAFTQYPSSPLPSQTSYQHPAHSPPSQQQPYFPPPPPRDYAAESEAVRLSHEMPAVTSPKPKKKSWGD